MARLSLSRNIFIQINDYTVIGGVTMFKSLENMYEYAPIPLRVGLAALFLTTGIMKALNLEGTAQFMGSLGFPSPMIIAIIVMAAEILGGAFLLFGFLTRLAAGGLTILLIVAVISAYLIKYDPSKLFDIMKHLAWIGGTLTLMFSGPGKLSLDEKLFWE